MRTVITTLTDIQGRRTEIWQDCDTIGIGDAQFALTGFGDALVAMGQTNTTTRTRCSDHDRNDLLGRPANQRRAHPTGEHPGPRLPPFLGCGMAGSPSPSQRGDGPVADGRFRRDGGPPPGRDRARRNPNRYEEASH
jgi:hypothetical protein